MNLIRLAWKNLTYKPLNALLGILLFALSVGLVSLLLSLRKQADEQFDANLAGVNLVVGAKGSPLNLVLNSMYHLGYPNGNVSLGEVRAFLNPRHPLIEAALPLSLGDGYRGYRIVGTVPDILDWYGAEIGRGEVWQHDFEVVVGPNVVANTGLKMGDTFRSAHGIVDEGEDAMEHEGEFKVVGILAESGTVLDDVILTTNPTYWHTHDHGGGAEDHQEDDHADHDHDDHEHADHADHNHVGGIQQLLEAAEDKELTSILVRYKGINARTMSFARNINDNTDLLAAEPPYQINEVRRQFDNGQRILRILVIAIIIVSALSIFISLFSSLRDRRYELAMLRVMGSGRGGLFGLIVLEGLFVAAIGALAGLLLSHGILAVMANNIRDDFRYQLDAWRFLPEEGWMFLGALALGFLAAVIPAIQAARTDIGETLTEG
ncbi:ABC transporter permease [Lewinella sp. W8]|uniref:ABC transporter permease n=1 Tax=Lewinella sp. W8 TaxID=2528208 RepID=UPI0010684202|nr:FtsX-like permease family protein [Lewinella sp. W8]MTB51008.1 FtsX-like permease family protein [Lewinella sp. W8]